MVSRQPEAFAPSNPGISKSIGSEKSAGINFGDIGATSLYSDFGQGANFAQPWANEEPVEAETPVVTQEPPQSTYDPNRPLNQPWLVDQESLTPGVAAQSSDEQSEPVSLLKAAAATVAAQLSGPAKSTPARQLAIAQSEKVFLGQPRQVGKYAGIVVLRQKIYANGRRHWYGLDALGNRHHLGQDAILESFMGAAVPPQGHRPKVITLGPGDTESIKQEIAVLGTERDDLAAGLETRLNAARQLRESLQGRLVETEAQLAQTNEQIATVSMDTYRASTQLLKTLSTPVAGRSNRSLSRRWREFLAGSRRELVAGLALAGIILGVVAIADNNDENTARVYGRVPALSQPSQNFEVQPATSVSPTPTKPAPTSIAPTAPGTTQPVPKLPAASKAGKHRAGNNQYGKTGHVARHGHDVVQAVAIHRGSSVWKTMEAITIDGKHIPRDKLWAASWIEMKANHISKAHEVQTGWRLKLATAKLAKLLSTHRADK